MKVRWNTTLAELERAQLLQPALDSYVNDLPSGLTGKPRRVAQARKKKWEMSSWDWEFVSKLVKGLEVLKLCMLEFSRKGVPTITKVLPLYKLVEVTLTALATKHAVDEPRLRGALRAGAAVATKYISNALVGDYALLASVLHPAMRVAFFAGEQWDSSVAIRARQLLLDIVKKYAEAQQVEDDSEPSGGIGMNSAPKSSGDTAHLSVFCDGHCAQCGPGHNDSKSS
ncbi:hypothetical protein C8F04DRAFT_499685 [Mycena alexandri]|uniref:Uncharacterized protein n=1 Tax=Mycena alexandri TaxID=1745969 RepID=A0AAD6SY31_9AGAR|nr:hypothetical protein C8F04DRAFT_499685 [Mycena alexandri]